jgi:hypothetical protein
VCRPIVLLATTTLSVYKAWGMPSYGLRKQNEETAAWRPPSIRQLPPWGRYVVFGIIAVALLFSSCTLPVYKYA